MLFRSKKANEHLKINYAKYFLCNILLQDREDGNVIYSVELYNNHINLDSEYEKISKEVEEIYGDKFYKELKRREVKDPEEINKIFPQ